MPTDPNCLFCKIINGDIPADKVYEDDEFLAFNDINPQAPVHVLLIPKLHIETINELNDKDLAGKLFTMVPKLAKDLGIADDGYRTIVNCQEGAGQTVFHLHVHILGGRGFSWPPG